ncbi:TetR/AcrR family transcriptional regulator [Sulfurimonas autotrophica]|uniref:Transcriptional regulator, TetR family n=1 Tax=Sulfurimonas autotrophica (strain ATCC BAA-671 / DSM 16294 / JCM 11897 / OK10) TaxID=563040 RepID=E0UTS6_SULAO|nr:TetR/AcrR family transcriptional regulator [Sulfurimonas autotrophica]ADN09370.1 transcriptional regulator, TetR family [Sulfurimonas autotrophica DSM 16294]
MAIIVDKEQKKKDIAIGTKELILNDGINNITISQIAKAANIGKGTVYEYFKNKDEIVFELVEILMQEHNKRKEAKLALHVTTREKVKSFFSFFYTDEDEELREIYKQFTAIALSSSNDDMVSFQTECYILYEKWMESIIQEGIANNELKPEAKELIMGIFAFAQGAFIMSVTTSAIANLEQKINNQIDILFDLMEK